MRESLSYSNKDECTFTPNLMSPENTKNKRSSMFGGARSNENNPKTRNVGSDYQDQLQKHVNRLTITTLRKEYER